MWYAFTQKMIECVRAEQGLMMSKGDKYQMETFQEIDNIKKICPILFKHSDSENDKDPSKKEKKSKATLS